tara:strand:+ start:65 stop:1501 length:1437 start_codon:yes stop_codon:yes gene_type:complete
MCGIAGGNLFTIDTIKESLDDTKHRGYDAQQVFEDGDIVLGHNRLSIQDLSETANQPFTDSTGRYTIVYNGELWKSMLKYRNELEKKYNFITENSDTELLLYMFIEYGVEVFQILDGMFSFAIHDKQEQKIWMGRDWIGRLPFYYFHRKGKLAFSSERKGLTKSLDVRNKHIKVVLPSHYYCFHIEDKRLEKVKYYSVPNRIVEEPKDKIVKNIREKIELAVDNELISDVPVCTILSGGIDSVIITYLLSKKVKNLEAFVVSNGIDEKKKDDLYYARKASEFMKIPLNEVIIDDEYVMSNLEDTVYAVEDDKWVQVSPAVAQLPMSKAIHEKGYKVVFGGEGSDEIFGSYGHIFAFKWKDKDYHEARIDLIEKLHEKNLVRTNKAMMYGGTVELRTPFLDKDFVEYGLGIPPQYKKIDNHWKPLLREAFQGEIPDDILWRPKKTFQVGCHTDFLQDHKELMAGYFKELFDKEKESIFW